VKAIMDNKNPKVFCNFGTNIQTLRDQKKIKLGSFQIIKKNFKIKNKKTIIYKESYRPPKNRQSTIKMTLNYYFDVLEGTKQPLFNRLQYILVKCSFYAATFPLKVLEFKFIFSKNLQNNKTHDLEFPNSIPIGHLGNLCHFDVVYVVIDKIFQ